MTVDPETAAIELLLTATEERHTKLLQLLEQLEPPDGASFLILVLTHLAGFIDGITETLPNGKERLHLELSFHLAIKDL